jgi:hypothetical protein
MISQAYTFMKIKYLFVFANYYPIHIHQPCFELDYVISKAGAKLEYNLPNKIEKRGQTF